MKKKGGKQKMQRVAPGPVSKLLSLAVWLAGVLVALAVGFGMISGTLTIPYIQAIVPFAGWLVVILTLLSVVLAVVDRF